MRKSKERNIPVGSECKKPAVYILDVAEVSCSQLPSLPAAPSSSSVSHDDDENVSVRISSSSHMLPISNINDGTSAGSQTVISTTNDSVPGSNSRSHSNALVDKIGEKKEESPNGQVNEDSPHAAWYRIIYKVLIPIQHCTTILYTISHERATVNDTDFL